MKLFKRLRFFLHAVLIESLAIGLIAFILISNNSLPTTQSENSSSPATAPESRDVSTMWGWWNKDQVENDERENRAAAENRIGLFGYVFE